METALGDHCSDGTVSGAVRNTLCVRLLYQYTWKQSYHKGKRPPYLNKESSRQIDPSHKSHNASDICPTMHHFVTEMCTHVHISVTNWCIVEYETGEICATGLFVGLWCVTLKMPADKLHFQLPNNFFRPRKNLISNWQVKILRSRNWSWLAWKIVNQLTSTLINCLLELPGKAWVKFESKHDFYFNRKK